MSKFKEPVETMGARVQRLRYAKGKTSVEASKDCGFGDNWFYLIESGTQKKTTPRRIQIIAEYLGTSTEYILFGKESKDTQLVRIEVLLSEILFELKRLTKGRQYND